MRNRGPLALCAMCILALAASVIFGAEPLCAQQPATPTPPPAAALSSAAPVFHEDLIAEVPSGTDLKEWTSAGDHVAWQEKKRGDWIVKLDGKQQGGTYEEVKHMHFSADGTRLAFFGKRKGKWLLVLDGQEGSSDYTFMTVVAFQPHGSSYAFCSCSEKKTCHLVVDGKESGADYEEISFPKYDSDGKRVAYFGKRDKKWFAVVDGKETGPELDSVGFRDWGFSEHANRFFAAVSPVRGKWTYIVDDAAGAPVETISSISFSSDDKHYVYGGVDLHGGFKKETIEGAIILDGQPVKTYEGNSMAGSWMTILGAPSDPMAEGPRDLHVTYHAISNPQFNSDGKLLYAVRREKGDIVVLNGDQVGPSFDDVHSAIVVSNESNHFVYIAQRGKDFVEVRDNQPGNSFPIEARMGIAEWMVLTKDGTHLAYELVRAGMKFKEGETPRARRSVVIDGQPGREYNALDIRLPFFSRDGRHYYYGVTAASGFRDLFVVDGHESKLYEHLGNGGYSADGKSVTFIAQDSSRLLRVTASLQ